MEGSGAAGVRRRAIGLFLLAAGAGTFSMFMLLDPERAEALRSLALLGAEQGVGAAFAAGLRSPVGVWIALPIVVPLVAALLELLWPDTVPPPADGAPVSPALDRPAVAQAGALRLLAVLQEEARLVDFVQEGIDAHSDAEVGAAARTVHAGVRKALAARMKLVPLHAAADGALVDVPAGFDPQSLRVSGRPRGNPPWRGVLVHPGWRVLDVRLPVPIEGADMSVLVPAEVEVAGGGGAA